MYARIPGVGFLLPYYKKKNCAAVVFILDNMFRDYARPVYNPRVLSGETFVIHCFRRIGEMHSEHCPRGELHLHAYKYKRMNHIKIYIYIYIYNAGNDGDSKHYIDGALSLSRTPPRAHTLR